MEPQTIHPQIARYLPEAFAGEKALRPATPHPDPLPKPFPALLPTPPAAEAFEKQDGQVTGAGLDAQGTGNIWGGPASGAAHPAVSFAAVEEEEGGGEGGGREEGGCDRGAPFTLFPGASHPQPEGVSLRLSTLNSTPSPLNPEP